MRRTVAACHSDLPTGMPVGALEPLVNGCFGDTAGIIKALMGFLMYELLNSAPWEVSYPETPLQEKKKKKSKKTKLSLILESHHALGTEKHVESGWESPKLTLRRSSF